MTIELSATGQDDNAKRMSVVFPDAVCAVVMRRVDAAAGRLVALGVSANAITCMSIALAAIAGMLLAFGRFVPAAVLMVIASLGDALDGAVARRGGSTSATGALLDASGDRYQEFFFLGGLAVFFRASSFALIVTLFALCGSFMISYGSAKAEALGVPVPPGVMRRAERAVCLCVGTLLAAPWQAPWPWLTAGYGVPARTEPWPVLASLTVIAVVANVSAVRRFRVIARGVPDGLAASLGTPVRRRAQRLPVSSLRVFLRRPTERQDSSRRSHRIRGD